MRDEFSCRDSDATSMGVSVGIDFGYIARTMSWTGSTEIDPANPRFRIVGEFTESVEGTIVDKVGWRTGWTWGSITKSCSDRNFKGYKRLICQDLASYKSDGGDSGAPVFRWNFDDTVRLYGVTLGQTKDGDSILSPIYRVQMEQGPLQTH